MFGTGTLQLSLGGTSFDVSDRQQQRYVWQVSPAPSTRPPATPAITATVISGSDGAHLVLSSTLTGAANTIQVAETDGG